MACCWDKLFFDGPVLNTSATLQDHRWWQAGGLVNMSYYETQGVDFTPKAKQAAFLSGRPPWLGPVTIDGSLQLPLRERTDVWKHLSAALGRELFHGGRWLRREPVFSNGRLAQCDFSRTYRYSKSGGTLRVIFLLIPPLFWESVQTSNAQLGGDARASDYPEIGEFEIFHQVGNRNQRADVVANWRARTDQDEVLESWVTRENQKTIDNPSTSGFVSWRTEVVELQFDDIAYFGGDYGFIATFYRANGGQRLLVGVDASRPPHADAGELPLIQLGDDDAPTTTNNEYVPVITVSLNAWDTARGLNRVVGDPLPDLPSAAYMAGLAQTAIFVNDTSQTIERWFNAKLQPPGGVVSVVINDTRVLVDPNERRNWTAFFQGLMTWQNVQDYSPPSAFLTTSSNLPAGYEDLVSVVQTSDAGESGFESGRELEVFDDGNP